jgi:hypothetical protein
MKPRPGRLESLTLKRSSPSFFVCMCVCTCVCVCLYRSNHLFGVMYFCVWVRWCVGAWVRGCV